MIDWFQDLPVLGSGVVIVGGFILLAVIIGLVITRFFPHEMRSQHNDLAGFILAVIGVVYAVLLAFVTVTVWERFSTAESRTYEEATALSIVYRDADEFPQASAIRAQIEDYVRSVVALEWPAMTHGERSPVADAQFEKLDAAIRRLPVTTRRQDDTYGRMLDEMDLTLQDRETRLSMDATGISPVMWMVLLLGALVTVSFTFLFGYKHGWMRLAMTGSLAMLIGLVLFLTVSLEYPFRGGITVGPEAFVSLQENLKAIER